MNSRKLVSYFCKFLVLVLGAFFIFCACIIAHNIGVKIAIAQRKARVELEEKNNPLEATRDINFFGKNDNGNNKNKEEK